MKEKPYKLLHAIRAIIPWGSTDNIKIFREMFTRQTWLDFFNGFQNFEFLTVFKNSNELKCNELLFSNQI